MTCIWQINDMPFVLEGKPITVESAGIKLPPLILMYQAQLRVVSLQCQCVANMVTMASKEVRFFDKSLSEF